MKLNALANCFEELNNDSLPDVQNIFDQQLTKSVLLFEAFKPAIRLAIEFNELIYKDIAQELSELLVYNSLNGDNPIRHTIEAPFAKEALLELLALKIISINAKGIHVGWPEILPYRLKFALHRICPALLGENSVDLVVTKQQYPLDATKISLQIKQTTSTTYFTVAPYRHPNHQILEAHQNNNQLFIAVTKQLETTRAIQNIYDGSHKITIRDLCEMTQEILTLIFQNRLIADERYRINDLQITLNNKNIGALLACGEKLLSAVQNQDQDLFDEFKNGLSSLINDQAALNTIQGFVL